MVKQIVPIQEVFAYFGIPFSEFPKMTMLAIKQLLDAYYNE